MKWDVGSFFPPTSQIILDWGVFFQLSRGYAARVTQFVVVVGGHCGGGLLGNGGDMKRLEDILEDSLLLLDGGSNVEAVDDETAD